MVNRPRDRNDTERGAPAERLADPWRERHADDIGERQPHEHRRDRASALFGATRLAATTEPTPKKAPWFERGDDARDHQRRVIARDGRQEIAKGEDRHQADQQGAAGSSVAVASVISGAPSITPSA